MPQPVSESLRQQIWERLQLGEPPGRIADALGLSDRTVRHLVRRFREDAASSPPRYANCGRRSTQTFAALRRQVGDWRRLHPGWGAGRILAELFPKGDETGRPDRATVRRWLARDGLAPVAAPRKAPAVPAPRACRVHDIWPMDACEKKTLRGGRRVCWLRLLDEASGAALFTRVFDQPSWSSVGGPAVQAVLRQAFTRWGRPRGLRVDNGHPWVGPNSDLPSDLEMWLGGLGVALHRGRPGVPQDNGQMERGQRTAKDWGEPRRHDTAEQLQQQLDSEDRTHREAYLFDGKRSRLEAYPELRHAGRPYAEGPCWEAVCWDYEAALACLRRRTLQRVVDKAGGVSLYDHRHGVGREYQGQSLEVRLGEAAEWVFTHQGREAGRCIAPYLAADNIRALQVRRRPGRSAQDTRKRRQARLVLPAESNDTPS